MPDPDDYHQIRLSAGIPQSTYDSITPTVIAIVNQIDVMILILRGSDHKHARFACELGFALMLNKPIIAVVDPCNPNTDAERRATLGYRRRWGAAKGERASAGHRLCDRRAGCGCA